MAGLLKSVLTDARRLKHRAGAGTRAGQCHASAPSPNAFARGGDCAAGCCCHAAAGGGDAALRGGEGLRLRPKSPSRGGAACAASRAACSRTYAGSASHPPAVAGVLGAPGAAAAMAANGSSSALDALYAYLAAAQEGTGRKKVCLPEEGKGAFEAGARHSQRPMQQSAAGWPVGDAHLSASCSAAPTGRLSARPHQRPARVERRRAAATATALAACPRARALRCLASTARRSRLRTCPLGPRRRPGSSS